MDNEVKTDSRARVSLNNPNTLGEMALTLGLPLSLSGGTSTPASVAALVPQLPLQAPFSTMAPNLLTLACRCVTACAESPSPVMSHRSDHPLVICLSCAESPQPCWGAEASFTRVAVAA